MRPIDHRPPPASLEQQEGTVFSNLESELREMNEALLVSAVRQHELAEQAARADASVHDSEERYRALFDSIDEGFCIIEMIFDEHDKPVDYRFLEVNPTFEKQCGLFGAVGKTMRELRPKHEENWFVTYGKVAMTGEAIRFTSQAKELIGKWYDCYACRVGGPESRKVAVVFNDITERKRSQDELRESHARFETLFDTSPVGMYLVDAQFRLRKMSAKTRAVFGGISDLIGRDFSEVVHILWPPALAGEIVARFRHTLATGEPFKAAELSEVRYDRNVREYYDWEVHRITLPDGQHGVVCYFLDISARVLTQQALRESEIRYRRLFETAKDGILILDAHTGKITDANAFMGSLVGQGAHEMLGKELHDIGLFGDTEASKQAFKELQENRYVRYEHLPVKNQHGGSVEVEVVANVYHEDHTLVAQCNVRDISQRVALEKKIAQQAEALAEESHRKDEFLAMLSHELRNPLAPIRSAVHLLKLQSRGGENPIQKQAREIIERQVGNLAKLVNDLLEVSRVVSGRIRLDRHVVDLNQIVLHAIETVRPLIDQHKHTLVVNLESHPGADAGSEIWIDADATRMEEVIINLLNNAAKYTPDGGRIEVFCERPLGTQSVQVRVRDNGTGIDRKFLPGIFDLFTQADRSLARSAGGLGIGLALVHRLVAMHGGTVEAQSPPEGSNFGSEFTVRLPLATVPAGPTGPEAAPAAEVIPAPDEGVRVLIIDDSFDQMTMLSMILEHKGYAVQSASNGPDGLTTISSWHPDIVLLDIGLPGLSGYDVAKRIRADAIPAHAGGAVRLIALTGYGRDEDKALAREAGFDFHATKPVDFTELEKMLIAPPA
jgi:PAS domain S-box-containing protein